MADNDEHTLSESPEARQVAGLFDVSELAKAFDTEEFKRFLDCVPIAIMISKLVAGQQRAIYVNKPFEALTGKTLDDVRNHGWPVLAELKSEDDPALNFGDAVGSADYYVGTFRLEAPTARTVETYASLIENEDGTERYRIFAFIDVTQRTRAEREEFSRRLRDKEVLLLELQHRVKNNLQLITALIRLEARFKQDGEPVNLERLAGRIEALQLLYSDLSAQALGQSVDLGHYLSRIASAAMHTYGIDGIRLDLKVDHALVSINIAMPVGLLVNELMTNAFKYAFKPPQTGTITVRCLHEAETSYRVIVSDDGSGLPEGKTWPAPGKLGALIVQTLRENAENVEVVLKTTPGKGTQVTIEFEHRASSPKLQ